MKEIGELLKEKNLQLDTVNPVLQGGFIVGAFKSIWPDSWGPRMEYILYNAIAALLDCQNTSLLGVNRLLTDENYRAWVARFYKASLFGSMVKLAQLIENHLAGILAHWKWGLTNAFMEGLNSVFSATNARRAATVLSLT